MATDLPNIFAHSPLDRATEKRSDDAWVAQAQAAGLVLPLWRGQIFTAKGKLGFLRAEIITQGLLKPIGSVGQIFLGLDKNQPHFACVLDDRTEPKMLLEMGDFMDLREMAVKISLGDSAIAAQARALSEWHKNHIFCARCGSETLPLDAGHKRFCSACELEHFPRTDPVVIMMITLGDKGFLGRQASWPAGFYSALAGFIEPGESIEEAVARESMEEAQIKITKTTYHSTQPWPYPYSLMIGCMAEAASLDFQVDGVELEAGRWFDRAELKAMFDGVDGGAEKFSLPPPLAIARRLIHHFVFNS